MALSRAVISSTNGLDEELLERISSNSIRNIVHEERNMVLQTEPCEHVLLNQHSDGFPIITSVFSLAPLTTNEVKTENHHLNMDSQHSFASSIHRTEIPNTFDYQEESDNRPVVSSFTINCHQDNAITVSSQTRMTEVKSENINLGFQNFLRGCYIIADSDTKLSNLLRVNGTTKNIHHSESQSEVLDNEVGENATNFGSKLPIPRSSKTGNYNTAEQPDLIVCNTADATNVGTMTDREERIRRLKNLLRQKEAEVEKIRFLSKKSTLSATIDKIKLRLLTENDSLSYQTSFAYPHKKSVNEQLPNLDRK